MKNYKLFDLSPAFQKHYNLGTKEYITKQFESIMSQKQSRVNYPCLQKTFDKLEFWSIVYVTTIQLNFEPCYQCIFKKTDEPKDENITDFTLTIDLGATTTETETDYQEGECYEDKFQFETHEIKKIIRKINKKEFTESFLNHLEKMIKIYNELVEKKNEKIQNSNQKLKNERKKYKAKYDNLESHLQRRMDRLETNKNSKNKLMKKSMGLRNKVNKYTKLMQNHQKNIEKINELLEDSEEEIDSNSDEN
ncbi:a-type inclusion protein [Anaeramoeba flamelloides]|uniref:A-type inclusion protein n=1 Tax=Anaeramoeba flamelloides TaxID=1746091 RepID=A0ABQ8YEV0_9EUKA|nr:a-type inclusion protein [Anaeramoeba flamelloides]